MWTPYPTRNNNSNQTTKVFNGRQRMYSAEDYLNAVYGAGRTLRIDLFFRYIPNSGAVHHDSSIESYDEDKRMLAFFDSLLQRELNGEEDDDESDGLSWLEIIFFHLHGRVFQIDDFDDLYILGTSDDDTSTENEEETPVDDLELE